MHFERAAFSHGALAGAEFWPDHPHLFLSRWQPGEGGDRAQATMTAVGFEPTPFRNGALSHRLRPLGQTVLRIDALRFRHDASRIAECWTTNPHPLLSRLKPGGCGRWQSVCEGSNCGARAHALSEWHLGPQRATPQLHNRIKKSIRCARHARAQGLGMFPTSSAITNRQGASLRSPAPQADDSQPKYRNQPSLSFFTRHARARVSGRFQTVLPL